MARRLPGAAPPVAVVPAMAMPSAAQVDGVRLSGGAAAAAAARLPATAAADGAQEGCEKGCEKGCERMEECCCSDEHEDCVHEVAMEGAEEDEMLSQSMVMTKAEVVRRRARRVKQLIKLYRMQYWALFEELRSKYRRFYLRTGKSGWREEDDEEEVEGARAADSGMREPHAPERSAGEPVKCGLQGCMAKPLPLSAFCFVHILLEPRQCLYKPCAFVVRSGQNGTCGKPVLRAVVPSFCAVHFQLAQKQAARVMKKASHNLPPLGAFAGKGAPKLHVLISVYVRAIQSKRRAAAAAAAPGRLSKSEFW